MKLPEAEHSWWSLMGFFGGIVFGIGLYSIVSVWRNQYLGHIVTVLCIAPGIAQMAFRWHCLV